MPQRHKNEVRTALSKVKTRDQLLGIIIGRRTLYGPHIHILRYCSHLPSLAKLLDDPVVAMAAVEKCTSEYQYLSLNLRSTNEALARKVCLRDSKIGLQFTEEPLYSKLVNDKIFMTRLVYHGRADIVMMHASTRLRSDLQFVTMAVKLNSAAIKYAIFEDSLNGGEETRHKLIETCILGSSINNVSGFAHLESKYTDDSALVERLLTTNVDSLHCAKHLLHSLPMFNDENHVSGEVLNGFPMIRRIVFKFPRAQLVKCLTERMKSDIKLLKVVCGSLYFNTHYCCMYKNVSYANSKEVSKSREFVIEFYMRKYSDNYLAIQYLNGTVQFTQNEMIQQDEFARGVLVKLGLVQFLNNPSYDEIVECVTNNGTALFYIGYMTNVTIVPKSRRAPAQMVSFNCKSFVTSKDIILKSLSKNSNGLREIPIQLRRNRQIAMLAVSQPRSDSYPTELMLLPDFACDKEIVTKAVLKNSANFRDISLELVKNNREFILDLARQVARKRDLNFKYDYCIEMLRIADLKEHEKYELASLYQEKKDQLKEQLYKTLQTSKLLAQHTESSVSILFWK